MTNDLHVAITNFRTALNKFWQGYVSSPKSGSALDMNHARAVLKGRIRVLDAVLEIRGLARCIEGILSSSTLQDLNKKED